MGATESVILSEYVLLGKIKAIFMWEKYFKIEPSNYVKLCGRFKLTLKKG